MSHFAVLLRWRCCTQCGTVSFLRASARSAVRHQEDCRSERLNCSRILLRPRTLSARAYAAAAEHHIVGTEDAAPEEAERIAARHALQQTVKISALDVPTRLTKDALLRLQSLLSTLPGTQVVVRPDDSATAARRQVLLCPAHVPPGCSPDNWPPGLSRFVSSVALESGEEPLRVVTLQQVQRYAEMTAAGALRLLLPADIPVPSAYEEVGHIVHLNLRDVQRPWGRLIGAVLLDKCPRARTIVNKLGMLTGPHRTFALQLLAGAPEYVARVMENGCTFSVDMSAVYWNSRLGPERSRLVALWGPTDTVLDLCAGAGPIAVAAARAGATVLANDVNPAATECLRANAVANGVAHSITVFTGDGVQLARGLLASDSPPRITQVVCNLPEHAPELVGAALRRAFRRDTWGHDVQLPVCHVYAFSKADSPEEDILHRIALALDVSPDVLRLGSGKQGSGTGPLGAVAWTHVRDVAPGKAMLRASFRLPSVASGL